MHLMPANGAGAPLGAITAVSARRGGNARDAVRARTYVAIVRGGARRDVRRNRPGERQGTSAAIVRGGAPGNLYFVILTYSPASD